MILSGSNNTPLQGNLSPTKVCFNIILKANLGKNHKFTAPVGNANKTGEMELYHLSPTLEYHQKSSDSCCFSNLASTFTAPGEHAY